MAAWHLEIRDPDGRTLCWADVEARRVGDIEGVRSGDAVAILLGGETVANGFPSIEQAKRKCFELHRWPIGVEGEPKVTKLR